MTTDDKYIPGVCNIGPAEIKRRRRSGWFGLGVTILLWLAFWIFGVPAAWMKGVFNFGSELGKTETVEQAEFRRKDQRKALLISLYSALIGIAAAILGFLLIIPR